MTKKFQRTIENFTCDKCGMEVIGDGYTDHCPNCLWGKHVDINPGDRLSSCGGPLKPVGIEERARQTRIKYKCQRCGYLFIVRAANDDNFDELIKVSSDNSV